MKPNLLAIVGPTASGKTALAIDIAQEYGGEIICADSRTVYKGLDIGTAKPSREEQSRAVHYLLDVVEPNQPFSVAQFQRLANDLISNIRGRGQLPILVGGSGLYIDSVLYNYQLRVPANSVLRNELTSKTVEQLQQILIQKGLPLPLNSRNPRHLVRAIETNGETPAKYPLLEGALIVGLRPDMEQLKARIVTRVEKMISDGLVDELRGISQKYGFDCEALRTPGYKPFRRFILGEIDMQTAMTEFAHNDWKLAKRQVTWFKANPDIQWFESPEAAKEYLLVESRKVIKS